MSFRHVLGVLENGEDALVSVLTGAVRLAEIERARLTLAKTTDPGRVIRWLRPCAALSMVTPMAELVSAEADLEEMAGHRLARAAEFVPASIPVTTIVLGPDTARALRALLGSGTYDVMVATAALLARSPRLGRELRRLGVSVLALADSPAQPEDVSEVPARAPRPAPQA
ncbi:MAG TPA: hypothetical protein VG388_09095 [Solirubrobacteraceae bacterium]|jgi:hypothetical protein|nr:hypothetical protein [Solirubrobacteraceae bacterium]